VTLVARGAARIVSDRRTAGGVPLVVHNIGAGTVEDDVLFAFTLTAHLRYLPEPAATACARSRSGS
jgi:uncharacterized protein YijF (DUF1287 family)